MRRSVWSIPQPLSDPLLLSPFMQGVAIIHLCSQQSPHSHSLASESWQLAKLV
jgi:hypothetical protein